MPITQMITMARQNKLQTTNFDSPSGRLHVWSGLG